MIFYNGNPCRIVLDCTNAYIRKYKNLLTRWLVMKLIFCVITTKWENRVTWWFCWWNAIHAKNDVNSPWKRHVVSVFLLLAKKLSVHSCLYFINIQRRLGLDKSADCLFAYRLNILQNIILALFSKALFLKIIEWYWMLEIETGSSKNYKTLFVIFIAFWS